MEAEEERDVENLFRPPDVERSRTLRLGLWGGGGGGGGDKGWNSH